MSRAAKLLGLLCLLLAGSVAPAAGQDGEPLRKSDLIRLLAARPASQVAATVRSRCLSFQPTPRDLEDLQAMGAGPSIMDAISACLFDAPGEASSDPAGEGSSEVRSELTLFLDRRSVRARPGESVAIRAEVTGGAIPASGVPLELVDAETDSVLARGTTGRQGVVPFELTAGERPGTRRFRVVSPDRELHGHPVVELEVTPEASASSSSVGGGGTAARGADRTASLSRADRLSRGGRYAQADRLYRGLLEREPERVDVLLAYGLHLSRTGAHGEAQRVLRRARDLAPGRADVSRALGMVSLWRGEVEEAVRWLRATVEAAPDDAEAWLALGRALARADRREEARRAFAQAEALGAGEPPPPRR